MSNLSEWFLFERLQTPRFLKRVWLKLYTYSIEKLCNFFGKRELCISRQFSQQSWIIFCSWEVFQPKKWGILLKSTESFRRSERYTYKCPLESYPHHHDDNPYFSSVRSSSEDLARLFQNSGQSRSSAREERLARQRRGSEVEFFAVRYAGQSFEIKVS